MASPKKAAPAPLSRAQVESLVRETVAKASTLKHTGFKKALPKTNKAQEADALAAARSLVERGDLYRWAKGKSEWFFAFEPVAALEKAAHVALAAGPLPADAFERRISAETNVPKECFVEWKKGALARNALFEINAGEKKKHVALEPDLRVALKAALAAVRKGLQDLESKGIARERAAAVLWEELGLPRPAPSSSVHDREAFLRELRAFASKHPSGALLPVGDLRSHLRLDKSRFDEIALSLFREGTVVLHHHDYAASLVGDELNRLVREPGGAYYVGIALKPMREDV
jgi:hypothetical protein